MLETSSLTARSSYRDAENLLKDDVRWKELDRGSREEEIRFFLQKLGDEEREVNISVRNNDQNRKKAYQEELTQFKAILEELHLTRDSRWSEVESQIHAKYTGKVPNYGMTNIQSLLEREQKNLFYDAVNNVRKQEETSRIQRLNQLRTQLFEYFDKLVCDGVIVPRLR